jgi:hypothetical protein
MPQAAAGWLGSDLVRAYLLDLIFKKKKIRA